ncbi:MAG: hypothetical protein JWQ16_2472 [Novosphingobium sp.]|nr:hypothetical protein [Novosphingobium sp.]
MNEPLSDREHARLAKALIDACGGLDEAARACGLNKSVLSRYQLAHYRETMPARVINTLECYAERRVYSDALAQAVGLPAVVGALSDLACEFSEETLELQSAIRKALSDGDLTPNEIDAIAKAEREAELALERLRAARLAMESARP